MITLKSLLMIIILHLFRAIHHKILAKLVDKVMHINSFTAHRNTSTSGEEYDSCLTVRSSNKQLQESEKMGVFFWPNLPRDRMETVVVGRRSYQE